LPSAAAFSNHCRATLTSRRTPSPSL
jgi:hypothetical protein